MSQASEQNLLELQIAIEQLQESVNSPSFGEKLGQAEELFRLLSLPDEDKAAMLTQLQELRQFHFQGRHDASAKLRQEVEQRLVAINTEPIADSQDWQARQTQLDQAKQVLEDSRYWLEMEGRRLTPGDRDACWQCLKGRQQDVRDIRTQFHAEALSAAEQLLLQARQAVQNGPWREVRETFKQCQLSIKQLPLRGREREQFRHHFDQLWQELQTRSQEHRQASKQRQEEGIKKLGDALSKVEQFIKRKEHELQTQQQQMEQAGWFDYDRLKDSVAKGEEALVDARRRQTEIQEKINAATQNKSS